MSDRERVAFLKFVGAYDVILYPGETIYIPPLWWHFLQYMDNAMSVSLRFGRSRIGRILYERFHPNMHLQNIAWKGFLGEKPRRRARKHFRRIIAEYNGADHGGFSLYLPRFLLRKRTRSILASPARVSPPSGQNLH